VAALALACMVSRAAALAAALAAVPLGWQLRRWLRSIRNLHQPRKQAVAALGIVAALLPTLPLSLLMAATPSRAAPAQPQPGGIPACDASAVLNRIGPAPVNLLAPIDLGPRLLLDSPHRVMATAHHRAGSAISDNMRAYIEPADAAHAIIARRQVQYVVVCTDFPEIEVYRKEGPGGLVDSLMQGRAPDWLEPVQTGSPDVMVWKVVA
ncbi:MAG TPA: hypothetical protein VHN58_05055, partial [Croceicoccus sp.]|nr:hypothetical protein [Croceicoccus sp.]